MLPRANSFSLKTSMVGTFFAKELGLENVWLKDFQRILGTAGLERVIRCPTLKRECEATASIENNPGLASQMARVRTEGFKARTFLAQVPEPKRLPVVRFP
jgi:hypothetical protein